MKNLLHDFTRQRKMLLWIAVLFAQTISGFDAKAAATKPDSTGPDHTLFTEVLREHVRNGAVDYKAIKQDKRFTKYLEMLEHTDPDGIAANERLAFWINAYNAFTIKRVIDLYPIKSIMSKLKYALNLSNFQIEFIDINGRKYSLNDIEHKIIRPFGDARIHFALVCAARSCPALRPEAYEASRLDEQLNEQGRLFLQDTNKNSFDFKAKKAEISSIFDWFKEDFEKNAPSVLAFISRYLPQNQAAKLKANLHSFKIEHKDYNWDLNDVKP